MRRRFKQAPLVKPSPDSEVKTLYVYAVEGQPDYFWLVGKYREVLNGSFFCQPAGKNRIVSVNPIDGKRVYGRLLGSVRAYTPVDIPATLHRFLTRYRAGRVTPRKHAVKRAAGGVYPKIGQAIQEARMLVGLTQVELARRLQIQQAHVCSFEYGKTYPSSFLLEQLKSVLGFDMYLWTWCLHTKVQDGLGEAARLVYAKALEAFEATKAASVQEDSNVRESQG